MRILLLAFVLGGCATSVQSARTLPVGKTEVTVQINRNSEQTGNETDDSLWGGDLMVRYGLADRFDLGVHLGRAPGAGNAISIASLDPKVRITDADAQTTVSIGMPIGVVFSEQYDDFDRNGEVLVPTLYVGQQISPTIELVIAPKLFILFPDDPTEDTRVEIGGSLGARFTDAGKHWAIHPELGFARITENNQHETIVTLGLGLAVGN